jgi:hypothetical protein
MTISGPQSGTGAMQPHGVANGGGGSSTSLGDILERVLDKGLVIAGDIQVNLLDIELLTIKLRLVIASLDTAREVGINWWETDPWLNADAGRKAVRSKRGDGDGQELEEGGLQELKDELGRLRGRIRELESGR